MENRIQAVQQQVNQLVEVFTTGSYMNGFNAMHSLVGECKNILTSHGITEEQEQVVRNCLAQCALIFHEISETTDTVVAVPGGFDNTTYPNL